MIMIVLIRFKTLHYNVTLVRRSTDVQVHTLEGLCNPFVILIISKMLYYWFYCFS